MVNWYTYFTKHQI